MLLKRNRVDTKGVENIFKNGVFYNSPNLTFKFIKTKDSMEKPRISFIAPKTIAQNAIKRNLLRRRGYSALKNKIDLFPTGLMGVFIFRNNTATKDALDQEIQLILSKI
jgi:ribonuclease P protein component